MYPILRQGQITGTTSKPNPTSSTPVDEAAQAWLDYLAVREAARLQAIRDRINNDPVLKAIVLEIEELHPGFIQSVRDRL
jgi:hypothetical protein